MKWCNYIKQEAMENFVFPDKCSFMLNSTRSLVYKGMVYKGFFRPSTGFPEKIRVPSTGSGRPKGLRKYVSIEV